MQCEFCGSEMQPGNRCCPFCGLTASDGNGFATQTAAFETSAHQTANQSTPRAVSRPRIKTPLILFFILLILNICALALVSKSWDISHAIVTWQVNKDAQTHLEELQSRLEAQDYIGYHLYYQSNDLYACSELDDYYAVTLACDYLYYLYETAVDFSEYREYAFSAEALPDTAEDFTDYASFIFSVDQRYNYDPAYVAEDKLAIISDIQNQAKAILVAYCGLTREEAEQFPDFSYTKQYEIIERGLSSYEIQ